MLALQSFNLPSQARVEQPSRKRSGKRKAEDSLIDVQEALAKRVKVVNSQALIEAARKGDIQLCITAIREGADVNFQSCGLSPLFYAAFYGHSMVIEYLVNCSANVNEKNLSGVTPLAKAVDSGHLSAVECLLRHGADSNIADNSGNPPLVKATKNGRADLVRCLIETGRADVDRQNIEKSTALHEAALKGNKEIVDLLLEAGAKPDVRNLQGKTALLRAVAGNHLGVIRALLDHGANINAQDSLGFSALHYSSFFGFLDCVKLLVERNADRSLVENVNKRTPTQIAMEKRHYGVAEYLGRLETRTIPLVSLAAGSASL